MDFVTPVMDVATRLWSCTSRHASYVINLEENMCSLRIEMEELRNVGEDVKRRVEDAENHQTRRRNEINGWLNRLDSIEREVNEILEEGDQEIQKRSLRNFCTSNYRSSYNIGRRIREKIPAVFELKNKGHFDAVEDRLPYAPVDENPLEKTVGLDFMFSEIWKWLGVTPVY